MMQSGLDEDDLQELEVFERHTDAIVKTNAGVNNLPQVDKTQPGWQSFETSKTYQEIAFKFHT